MRARDRIALSVIALCLATPASALPVVRIAMAGTGHHSAATVASDTADYIRNSAITDMFEIASAKIAQKTSHNYAIQRFAQMIIDDHTAVDDALGSTLKEAEFAMTLPAALDAPHDAIVKQLEDTNAADFDSNFMQQQIIANESALRVQTSYARNGRDLSLRKFASQTIPTIVTQLGLAERIFQRLSPKTASTGH